MGSIPGVIVGAIALVGLPELLREFAEYRLLVYGAALVAMMLLRPEGLWPEAVHRRELHKKRNWLRPNLSQQLILREGRNRILWRFSRHKSDQTLWRPHCRR